MSGATYNLVLEQCSIRALSASANVAKIALGNAVLIDCTLQFGHVNDSLQIQKDVVWMGGGIIGSVFPTHLLSSTAIAQGRFEGLDLKDVSTSLIDTQFEDSKYTFLNCKIHASATISSSVVTPSGFVVQAINCDSGDTNYRTEKHAFNAALSTETTIVRTGGASDGTTPIAWKVVTSTLQNKFNPFESPPIQIWNETTGSALTVTVECRAAAIPNDNEVWMEVEYLGTSSSTQASITRTRPSHVAAGAANTSSSEAWGGSTASFKLAASVTPQEKGPITVRIYAGKASHTFYVDPKITIT
jgi:hypothetical protein